jgi:hypothetical protein
MAIAEENAGHVASKIRKTILAGNAVAVLGWTDRNHSSVTRSLPPGKVCFLEAERKQMPANVAFVLLTRFVSHTVSDQVKKRGREISKVLGIGEIKRILESCADIFFMEKLSVSDPVRSPAVSMFHAPRVQKKAPLAEKSDGNLETKSRKQVLNEEHSPEQGKTLVEPHKEKDMVGHTHADPMLAFAQAFMEVANNNKKHPGCVGKYSLSETITKTGTPGKKVLEKEGWIAGKVSDGRSRVGNYVATDKLLGLITSSTKEPTEPIALARFRITQEESIKKEVESLNGELAAIDATLQEKMKALQASFDEQKQSVHAKVDAAHHKLAQIASAKELLKQLETLMAG